MARISSLTVQDVVATGVDLSLVGGDFSALPNSILTLGHVPQVLQAVLSLWSVTMGTGRIERGLKYLVGHVASHSAGCRYCMAHTAHNAHKLGVSQEQIDDIWSFESSPRFDDRSRAALRFALLAGQSPNGVDDLVIVELRHFFADAEIAELLSVVSIYGFFNRWNDSLATQLEADAKSFSTAHLGPQGWNVGAHA